MPDLIRLRATNIAGERTGLFFKRADMELFRPLAIAKICLNEQFEASDPFALSHMDKLMKQQFAITPRIGSDDYAVPKGNAATGIGDHLRHPGRLCQFLIVRKRHAIHDENSDLLGVANSGQPGIRGTPRT